MGELLFPQFIENNFISAHRRNRRIQALDITEDIKFFVKGSIWSGRPF